MPLVVWQVGEAFPSGDGAGAQPVERLYGEAASRLARIIQPLCPLVAHSSVLA
jgi:hypothetical protein